MKNGLDKITYMLNNVVHKASQVILFMLMLLTTGDVVGRYFLNKPITGTYEITGLGLVLIIFFSLGIAQVKKDHIEIDFLTSKFPLKVRHGMKVITSLILFILVSLTTWQMIEYANRLWKGNDVSGDLGFPIYIFAILASIGTLFFALSILADVIKSLKAVRSNES